MTRRLTFLLFAMLGLVAAPVLAADAASVVEHRFAIVDGKVAARPLADHVLADLSPTPATAPASAPAADASIDLNGSRSAQFLTLLGRTLGPGCDAAVRDGSLVVRIDRKAAWNDPATVRRAGRLLATGDLAAPAAGQRFGLTLPEKFDPARPLVLLIHGLASDNDIWGSMAEQMTRDGYQVGYYCYAESASIAAAGELLADRLGDLRVKHPKLVVRIVAHSMGGLVARHYLEGDNYHGGVDRIVMLGTPNGGSYCSNWRWMLDLYQHYYEGKKDPEFSLKKVATQCNGEAGRDLLPGSAFLTALNAKPRRAGVTYAIVAGNRDAFRNTGAGWVECTGDVFPNATNNWIGVRHIRWAVSERGKSMRSVDASTDGVVPLDSAKLAGVDDFVVVPADHVALACGHPPAAWDAVKARLAK